MYVAAYKSAFWCTKTSR